MGSRSGSLWEKLSPDDYFQPRRTHDLLSPPPFLPPHGSAVAFTYAMGLYEPQAPCMALFELREPVVGDINETEFLRQLSAFAEYVFKFS